MLRFQLSVRVNEALVLDAGWWEETLEETLTGGLLPCRLIHAPVPTMYEQVLGYLAAISSVSGVPSQSQLNFGEVGLATIAVCLRWGTYFAVLADRTKPLWAQTEQPEISQLGDPEMARINIEASAALAQWIELMRADDRRFGQLVRAAQTLPMHPQHLAERTNHSLYQTLSVTNSARARQNFFAILEEHYGEAWLAQKRAEMGPNSTRALANGLIDAFWRNGSGIEDIHAGIWAARPLQQRRITLLQEDALVRQVAEGIVPGMHALYNVARKKSDESWEDRALALALKFSPPRSWSLSEQTAEVLLEGPEP
ncbi:MAG TPA: hypothetical protein VGF67_20175 [Ktedonobacteraceae bacterium]|jgi:hypothetical protein